MVVALCRRHLRPQPETPPAIPLPQQKNDSAGNAPETVVLCHFGLEEFVTDHRCIVSDMVSLRIRNGYAAVAEKHGSVGRTMSQHAIWHITMHFGNALNSARRGSPGSLIWTDGSADLPVRRGVGRPSRQPGSSTERVLFVAAVKWLSGFSLGSAWTVRVWLPLVPGRIVVPRSGSGLSEEPAFGV
jgi:hypothetical protein